MRSLCLPVVALLVVVLAVACEPGDPNKDRTPPRVLTVEPAAPVVAVDVALRVTLSETVVPESVDGDPISETLTVALVPRAQASESFLSDFDNPGISESRQGQLVPVDVDVDSDAVSITPTRALEPRTAYTLLLGSGIRDTAQNPLVDGTGLKATFRYDFQTDDGQPEVVDVDVDGGALIAPNRRRIAVAFNQPVQNVTSQTLTLTPSTSIEAILLNAERTAATVVLGAPATGCARLEASTTYTLAVSDDVVGDTGQALAPFAVEFTTGSACDESPNFVVDGPDAIAGETAATIRFETTKASTTEVRFGLAGGALDCLGAACPGIGNPARVPVPGTSPPRFLHSVEVAGLEVGNSYEVVVSAEDDVGITASARVSFVTAPLPKVAINEVMANPPASFASEAVGEYVEIANFGDVVVDVSGWAVLVEGGEDGGGCTAVLPEGLALNAGAFLLIAGRDFDGAPYALGGDVVVARLANGASNGMCSLVNSRAQPLLLTDSDGRPVSSVSSYSSIVPDEDGRSVERTAPAAADVEESFCLSRNDAGPTPGRANSVSVEGCD
jgi:hypothetical protein